MRASLWWMALPGMLSVDCGSSSISIPPCADADGDGFGAGCERGPDCDDQDPLHAPSCPARLAWDAPTANTDGSPLGDLAGYRLYWGAASAAYSDTLDLGMPSCQESGGMVSCTYTLEGLTTGRYYLAITAYNSGSYESAFSNEVEKTIP